MLSGVLGVIESISSDIMSIWLHHNPYSDLLNKRPKISPPTPPPPQKKNIFKKKNLTFINKMTLWCNKN